MTRQDLTERGTKWAALVLGGAALMAVLIAAVGFETKQGHAEDIAKVRAEQEMILRKLDCALFDLPHGCRNTMAPRSQ
jgi:hypothetical protein